MESRIRQLFPAHQTIDGAGVRLKRVFSNDEAEMFDPFLLLDNFGSDRSEDYLKGFPWHPHRGIETVTYMLSGEVKHGDSLGNKGTIYEGDLQWMSAGSGIIHEEMPQLAKKKLDGMQLWVNLPKKQKMSAPRYREIKSDAIPMVKEDGAIIKVIAGTYEKTRGPVKDLVVDVTYLDVSLKKDWSISLKESMNSFIYMFEGKASIAGKPLSIDTAALLSPGQLNVHPHGFCRFILVSGKPLREPIAWGGPIVMNTHAELETAFRELDEGTFIRKHGRKPVKVHDFYKD